MGIEDYKSKVEALALFFRGMFSSIKSPYVVFILFVLFSFSSKGQTSFRLIDSFTVSGQLIGSDKLSQLYILSQTDEISKLNPSGESLFKFSDNTLGKLSYLDTTDPFNLLAFYADFQVAKVLDRTLNPNIEYDFANLDFFNVVAVTMGVSNRIWIYEQQEGKLLQLDQNGQIIRESPDLNFLIGQRPKITRLQFYNNQIWMLAEDFGLLHFDQFGQLVQQIPRTGIKEFWIIPTAIIARIDNNWEWLNVLSKQWQALQLPLEGLDTLKIVGNKCYSQKGNLIYVYEID